MSPRPKVHVGARLPVSPPPRSTASMGGSAPGEKHSPVSG